MKKAVGGKKNERGRNWTKVLGKRFLKRSNPCRRHQKARGKDCMRNRHRQKRQKKLKGGRKVATG